MDLFEQAARLKLRFPSTRGDLTAEQLFDLPLLSPGDRFDLDTVAKSVNAALKATSEESFVSTAVHPAATKHQLQLDVVKSVIATKQSEAAAAKRRADRAAERRRLVEALGDKQDEKLRAMSISSIQKRLDELDQQE